MILQPGTEVWRRVEQLAEEWAELTPEEIAVRLQQLKDHGESPTIVTLLGRWLALPPPPSPLSVGSVVGGRYTLKEVVGQGGMGFVWRAAQRIIEQDVALKMIHPSLATPEFRSCFVREIQLLGRLKHPGIVRIFDADIHEHPGSGSSPFFTMELVDGVPLDRWAAPRRDRRADLLRLVAAVCDSLQNAHEQSIVHRDIKPANIVVRADGSPVVLDFGIARLAVAGVGDESGVFSGTPHYAAPEQHRGDDLDLQSGGGVDIYSLGVVLFEVLSGRRPLEFDRGSSLLEMRRAIIEGRLLRLTSVLPDCPRELEEIVSRALRREPIDRFLSMAEFGRALRRVAAQIDPGVPTPAWAPAPAALVPGTGWRLTEKLGEGSAGEIWLGAHEQLREQRVFKFCDTEEKARTLKREMTLFRLLRERVGRNPHFVPLHQVSLHEEPWYLMMDHVDARDLPTWLASRPGGLAAVPEEVCLEIVAQAAEALQAAHQAGILHRDIKPSNLLVRIGKAEDWPHVLIVDFGIGQIVADDILRGGTRLGFTRTVSDAQRALPAGTLLYLAPELQEGRPSTTQSDIYSLGVVLWQLLIRNLTASPAGWTGSIQDPLLNEDLKRCLAPSPDGRWASAGELATSLRLLPKRRAEESRRAEAVRAVERVAYRRGIVRTAMLAAGLVALFGWMAWFSWQRSIEAGKQRRLSSVARTRAVLGELQAVADLKSGAARMKLEAEIPTLEGGISGSEATLRETAIRILALPEFKEIDPSPWALSDDASVAERGERLIRHDDLRRVETVDLSAEPALVRSLSAAGNALRLNASGIVAGGLAADGALELWHGNKLSQTSRISGPIHAQCFALSPLPLAQARRVVVAVARPDGSIHVSAVGQSNEPLILARYSSETEDLFPESAPATMLAFALTQEGVLAAAAPTSGNALFWRISAQKDRTFTGKLVGAAWHPDVITCMQWNPVADELATGSRDGVVRVWRLNTPGSAPQTRPLRYTDLTEPIQEIAWTPDGSLVAALLASGTIRVLQANALEQPPVATFLAAGMKHVAFVVGNVALAWGNAQCRAWGSHDPAFFAQRRVSSSDVTVDFQKEGCLTASGQVRVEFLNPTILAWTAGFQTESLHGAVWEGSTLYYHSDRRWQSARVKRESGSSPTLRLPEGPDRVRDVRFVVASPHGTRSAFVYTNSVSLHRGDGNGDGEGTAPLASEPHLLAVSDTEAKTAWIDDAGNLQLHDHAKGEHQQWPNSSPVDSPNGRRSVSLTFGPDSDLLIFGTESGIVFYRPSTQQHVEAPSGASGGVRGPLAFSRDGRWLAASRADHTILIAAFPPPDQRWQQNGAQLKNAFLGATSFRCPSSRPIVSLDWNFCASRLAVGTADGFVQCWNVSLLRDRLRLWKLDWAIETPPVDAGFVPVRLH